MPTKRFLKGSISESYASPRYGGGEAGPIVGAGGEGDEVEPAQVVVQIAGGDAAAGAQEVLQPTVAAVHRLHMQIAPNPFPHRAVECFVAHPVVRRRRLTRQHQRESRRYHAYRCPMCAPNNTGRTTIQRPRDGHAYAFCRRLGLAVADMCVAHRHARPLVVEQAADDRQRDSLQHGVAGERMTEIVHANVFDAGTLANFAPEPQAGRQRPPQIERRGEDEGARRSWLTVGGSRGVCRIRIAAEGDIARADGL